MEPKQISTNIYISLNRRNVYVGYLLCVFAWAEAKNNKKITVEQQEMRNLLAARKTKVGADVILFSFVCLK